MVSEEQPDRKLLETIILKDGYQKQQGLSDRLLYDIRVMIGVCVVDILYRYIDSMDCAWWYRNGVEFPGSRRLRRDLVSRGEGEHEDGG